MKHPIVEIRSVYDTIENEPYLKGSETDAQTWVAENPESEVWFFITNGDGSTEAVSKHEFLNGGFN